MLVLLSNPFLGLPFELGKCESSGASEAAISEGHFGYNELTIPIEHPNYITEMKKMLSLQFLKCLRMKKKKEKTSLETLCGCYIRLTCESLERYIDGWLFVASAKVHKLSKSFRRSYWKTSFFFKSFSWSFFIWL